MKGVLLKHTGQHRYLKMLQCLVAAVQLQKGAYMGLEHMLTLGWNARNHGCSLKAMCIANGPLSAFAVPVQQTQHNAGHASFGVTCQMMMSLLSMAR